MNKKEFKKAFINFLGVKLGGQAKPSYPNASQMQSEVFKIAPQNQFSEMQSLASSIDSMTSKSNPVDWMVGNDDIQRS